MDSDSSDAREIRAARNQALFRAINEKLTESERVMQSADSLVIACECADPTCVEALTIGAEAYRSVRANPRRFAVLPGHASAELEDVVSKTAQYEVAEKFGEAAHVAEQFVSLDG